MPPVASTRELILNDIVAALAAINGGSMYNFTIGEAALGLKHFAAVPSDKFPAAYVCGADEDRSNVTNAHFKGVLKAHIVGYVQVADASDTATLEKYVSRFVSDVMVALTVDPTRSGAARYTEVKTVNTDKGAWAPYAGFEIIVECEYRAPFQAP